MLGLNLVHWYIILVTSTTTGHDGSVVSALASHKYFLSSLSDLRWESN